MEYMIDLPCPVCGDESVEVVVEVDTDGAPDVVEEATCTNGCSLNLGQACTLENQAIEEACEGWADFGGGDYGDAMEGY